VFALPSSRFSFDDAGSGSTDPALRLMSSTFLLHRCSIFLRHSVSGVAHGSGFLPRSTFLQTKTSMNPALPVLDKKRSNWIPAFAGMTSKGIGQ
jgi:hypothetical protein